MSFKAIDGQVMLQKVNEVSRLQRLEQQQGQQLQDNAMLQIKKDANKGETSVNKLNYTEHNKINKERNEQGDKRPTYNEEEKQTDKSKDHEKDDLNLERHLGGVFDLLI